MPGSFYSFSFLKFNEFILFFVSLSWRKGKGRGKKKKKEKKAQPTSSTNLKEKKKKKKSFILYFMGGFFLRFLVSTCSCTCDTPRCDVQVQKKKVII